MIVSCGSPPRLPHAMSTAERVSDTLHRSAHQICAGTTEVASEKASGGRSNAATGSGRNEIRIRMRTVARTHLAHHLLTARTHGGVTQLRTHEGFDANGGAPLSSELRHCTA